jgi:hypothetical protein
VKGKVRMKRKEDNVCPEVQYIMHGNERVVASIGHWNMKANVEHTC